MTGANPQQRSPHPPSEHSSSVDRMIPWLLALILLVPAFASLRQYNVTWDEGLGDLFFGQRYASYFASLDSRYLDFGSAPYPAGYLPDLSASPFRNRPWEHYPVASTLATLTSRLFARSGLLDPFDGYHAFNLLIGAAFLIFFYGRAKKHSGRMSAIAATVLLFASPRIFGSMMANVKDFSEMVFFSAAVLAFFEGAERGRGKLLLLSALLWGLAMGTKANALFIPPIILAFVIWRGVPSSWTGRGRYLATIIGSGTVGCAVFFLTWPYLWAHPVDSILANLGYIVHRESGTALVNRASAFAMILYTMPVTFLLAFALGLIPLGIALRRRRPAAILVTCWIAVVGGRLVLPGAVNFDGVRHFLELFPPMAFVGGNGIQWISRKITSVRGSYSTGQIFRVAITALFLVPVLTATAFVHPFETTYWNFVAGGLRGAMMRGLPQASDYWAASYRLGLRWLDVNAPQDSILAVPVAEHTVRIVAPYRLRSDIDLVHLTNPWSPRINRAALEELRRASVTRPVYVMFVLRREWTNELMVECMRDLQPAVTWQVDGAPVLVIYRYQRAAAVGDLLSPCGPGQNVLKRSLRWKTIGSG